MPDEGECGYGQYEESVLSKALWACGGIAFIGAMAWAMISVAHVENESRAFIATCIEFHSLDRCVILDQYGRRDLGR